MLGLAWRVGRSGGANQHSQKNNANEGAFHRRLASSLPAQLRAASVHRARTSSSERTRGDRLAASKMRVTTVSSAGMRSEEHTSELQSRLHLVCRLLLE